MSLGRKLKDSEKKVCWTDECVGDFSGDPEIIKEAKKYEEKGFGLELSYAIPKVVMPNGDVFGVNELKKYLYKHKLEIGNDYHLKLRDAFEYISLWGQWTGGCIEG